MTTTSRSTKTPTSSEDGDSAGVVRLSVNLAPDVADTLKKNAQRKGLSITEAIRRAIAVWAFLEEAKRKGQRLALIEDLGGGKERMREVVIVD